MLFFSPILVLLLAICLLDGVRSVEQQVKPTFKFTRNQLFGNMPWSHANGRLYAHTPSNVHFRVINDGNSAQGQYKTSPWDPTKQHGEWASSFKHTDNEHVSYELTYENHFNVGRPDVHASLMRSRVTDQLGPAHIVQPSKSPPQ